MMRVNYYYIVFNTAIKQPDENKIRFETNTLKQEIYKSSEKFKFNPQEFPEL
jgi:alpha-glucosidase (family GH31 glycosyl hydrolase)